MWGSNIDGVSFHKEFYQIICKNSHLKKKSLLYKITPNVICLMD